MVQDWDRLLYVFTYHGWVWFRVKTGYCMYLHTMAGYGSWLRQVIVGIYIPWPGMVQGWDRLLYVFTYHGRVWFRIETGYCMYLHTMARYGSGLRQVIVCTAEPRWSEHRLTELFSISKCFVRSRFYPSYFN